MTDELVQGDRVEVTVGAPAHGGHCVARIGGPGGRVVFVRNALPGERVTAEITELHKGFLRADAVIIHEPSPDRVEPPCPWSRPGLCGGCDLQHVEGDAQLRWKSEVVREQLRRLAKIESDVRVEALPDASSRTRSDEPAERSAGPGAAAAAGSVDRLLGWRTRVRYAVDATGRAGLLQHRSHQVVPIDRCRIAHPAVQQVDVLAREWVSEDAIEVVTSSTGDVAVLTRTAGGVLPPDDPAEAPALGGGRRVLLSGPDEVVEVAAGRQFHVRAEGFWQVHPAAAETLTATVLEMLRPAAGEVVWDLYGGAGLFAAAVAERTEGPVVLVEASSTGVAEARRNLAGFDVQVVQNRVDAALRHLTDPVDLVVLDPPRAGAGAKVVRGIAAARPRAVAYVACDPASLARDIATFRSLGWELADLRAFDCFPMTQHVECVALLLPGDGAGAGD